MGKLHELLAVEGQLKDQANKCRGDLRATFDKKRHLFEEKVVTFQPKEENVNATTEQRSDLQTTVQKELDWLADIWSKAMNVSLAVAEANTQARADIVLDDGTVILTGVPATALLELEKRAAEMQEVIAAIPTLDPAKGFRPDPARGVGVFQARDHTVDRTKKLQRPIVLFPATDQHPAQTQLITEDVVIGRVVTNEWSGLVTPAAKADMLARCESLRRAIKQARSRANEQTTDTARTIGDKLFGYVFKA